MIKKGYLIIYLLVGLVAVNANAFSAQINFIPELEVSAEYTDNLFLHFDDNLKEDDVITTAGISLNLEALGQTGGLNLTLNPSYQSFREFDNLNYWRYFGNLRAWNSFKRNTRLEFNSIYLETEDPRDSTEADADGDSTASNIDVDPTRRERNRYSRNTNDLRLTHQFGANSNVHIAIGYNFLVDIDIPEGEEVDDYNEVRPEIGIEYWIERRWGFMLDSYLSDRDYEDRDDRNEFDGRLRIMRSFGRHLSLYIQYRHTVLDFDENTVDEDYQILAPSAGIDYQIGQDTNLRIGAGYYFQDLDEGEDDEASFIDAEINHVWNFRTGFIELTATSGYDIEDTGSEDLGLQIYYDARIDAGYSFSSRVALDFFAFYRNDDYPNYAFDRSDQTLNAGTGISYQALRWLNLRLSYEHEKVSSDVESEEFVENSYMFTMTMAPSSPFRLN